MFVEKSWHDFMQYPTAQCCNIILHNTHSILICHFWATRQINRAASLTPSQSDIFYMFSYDSEKYSITWYHHSAHPSSILHTICSLLIEDGPTTLNFGYDFFFQYLFWDTLYDSFENKTLESKSSRIVHLISLGTRTPTFQELKERGKISSLERGI